jgi:hypothetical protein
MEPFAELGELACPARMLVVVEVAPGMDEPAPTGWGTQA